MGVTSNYNFPVYSEEELVGSILFSDWRQSINALDSSSAIMMIDQTIKQESLSTLELAKQYVTSEVGTLNQLLEGRLNGA